MWMLLPRMVGVHLLNLLLLQRLNLIYHFKLN
jgi:hypothetical protein